MSSRSKNPAEQVLASRRVLLLGANGQVGAELATRFAGTNLLALDRAAADLSQPESLRAVVRAARPDLILNAAAYTAVDRAESEPELADRVNHLAPAVLAEEAERVGAILLHYSTDYVFDGTKTTPWVETDEPNPLNVYGATKLAGERAIAARCPRHIILRTSWVYGPRGHNFLLTMLRLGREREVLRVVDDQWGAPTSAGALAEATLEIVDRTVSGAVERWAGVYHSTCAGTTSWYGFAQRIFEQARQYEPRVWPRLEKVATAEFPASAKRPSNSVLENRKLAQTFAVQLPDWTVALKAALEQCGLSQKKTFQFSR